MGELTEYLEVWDFESAVACLNGMEDAGDVKILKALARMFGCEASIGGYLYTIVAVAVNSIMDMERVSEEVILI